MSEAPSSLDGFKQELADARRRNRRRALLIALPFAVIAIAIGIFGTVNAASQRAAVAQRIALTFSALEPNDFLGERPLRKYATGEPYDELMTKKNLIRRPESYVVERPLWTLFGSCVTVRTSSSGKSTRVFLEVERRGWWDWAIVEFGTRGMCE